MLGHLDLVRHEDLYDSGTKTLIPTIWMVVDKIKKASMSHVEIAEDAKQSKRAMAELYTLTERTNQYADLRESEL